MTKHEKSMKRLWKQSATLLLFACLILFPLVLEAATCVDISRTLSLNTKGADVSLLQEFLRTNAGYGGAMTGNMGPLTVAALTRWQIYKSIIPNASTPGAGTTGPRTRAALACTKAVALPSSPLPIAGSIVRTLSKGMSGADVTTLQTFLIAQGFLSATATGYFGPLTEAAVRRYQAAQNIVSSGTPATTGYGAVGPRTRAAIRNTAPSSTAAGIPPSSGSQTRTTSGSSGGGGGNFSSSPAPNPSPVATSNSAAPPTSTPVPMPTPTLAPALRSCTQGSVTLQSGQSALFYPADSVLFPATCSSQSTSRTCTDGVLSGSTSFSFPTCEQRHPEPIPQASCTLDGETLASGSSQTFYSARTVTYGAACSSVAQARTCTNGTLSGTYQYSACVVSPAASCTWSGQSVAHGASVTAYQAASVPFGSSCVSQTRTCTNGTLSGSYTASSCVVGVASSCTWNNASVQNGQSVTAYQSATVPYGQQCTSQSRVCSSGALSGTYQYSACVVSPAASCTWSGQSVAHGASVTAYQTASVPNGQQCVSEQRTCTNTQFSGTYQYASCTPEVAQLIANGVACTSNSQCSSGYCYPGPSSTNYCIAANKNCAKPSTDGILYGEEYLYGGNRYQCAAGVGLQSLLTASASYAQAKGIFQTLFPQYMNSASQQLRNNGSFILYNMQYQLMNFAIRVRRENDIQALSQLAQLASTYPLEWLRNAQGTGLPTPNTWQDINGPVTWSDASPTGGNIDNLNNVVQWMYFVGHLMNSISQVPRASRTVEMNRFLDVYSRIFSFNVPEMVFSADNAMGWDFRGWTQCSGSRLSHEDITTRRHSYSLTNLPDAPCNAVLDWDLQLYGAVLEYRKAVANDPTYVNYFNDSAKDSRLIAYLGKAYDAVENHIHWSSLRDFNGNSVDGYIFNKGLWSTHPDYAFAGNSQTTPPVRGQEAQVSGVGEDMGHHVRLTWVLLSMYENKSIVGKSFPRTADMRYYANQITYGVFNHDFASPKFATFNDGSNGWFRHYLNDGASTLGGPWTGTIGIVSSGYGFYSEFGSDVDRVISAIAPAYMVPGIGGDAARSALSSGYVQGCTYNASSNTWSTCSPYPSYVGFGPSNAESLSFFSQYSL